MTEHQKWVARRIYHETFSKPRQVFPNWEGSPNRCKCGCGEEWTDRVSPINWWLYLNPGTYAPVLPHIHEVFRALHHLLSLLPRLSWHWFQMTRKQYKARIRANPNPEVNTTAAIVIAWALLYGVAVPMTAAVACLTWILTRPGSVSLMILEAASIALYMSIALTSSVLAALTMSMAGIVVIIAGMGSIVYFNSSLLGIALMIIGVLLQYELNRRQARQLEERLGKLVLLLREQQHNL